MERKGATSSNEHSPPPYSKASDMVFTNYKYGLSVEHQIESLIVSSRLASIMEQIQQIETTDTEFLQRLIGETETCQICRNEVRPNHILKARVRKEWLIYKTISEETGRKLEGILDQAGDELGSRFYLEAEIIEELQEVYRSSLTSGLEHILREIKKRKKSVSRLQELNVLIHLGIPKVESGT